MNRIDGRACRHVPARIAVWFAMLGSMLLTSVPASFAENSPADPRGFLYGKVTVRSGTTYEGRIRWGGDEAFWGDHFESVKKERPHLDKMPPELRDEPFKIFGITLGSSDDSRSFFARFGDIRRIDVGPGDRAEVTMKSGTKFEIDGGSDVGRRITVWDPEVGPFRSSGPLDAVRDFARKGNSGRIGTPPHPDIEMSGYLGCPSDSRTRPRAKNSPVEAELG